MKRNLALTLTCAMVLSLTACSGGGSAQPSTAPTPSPTPALTDYSITVPLYALTAYDITEDVQIQDFVFDDQGRLTGKQENHSDITYTYDQEGRLTQLTDVGYYGTDTSDYTYQESGLVDTESEHSDHSIRDGNVFSYQYVLDDAGQVTKLTIVNTTDPDHYTSEFTFEYNAAGYVVSETEYGQKNTYLITPFYDCFGRLIGSDSGSMRRTYTYGEAGTLTLSTGADSPLVTADQWTSFTEAEGLPTPDSCVNIITAGPESDTYTYCLPDGDAVSRFLAYDRPTIPGGPNQAHQANLMYCTILSDVLGYTLEEQSDGSTLVSLEGVPVATLSVTLDEQYGPLLQISF